MPLIADTIGHFDIQPVLAGRESFPPGEEKLYNPVALRVMERNGVQVNEMGEVELGGVKR